MFRTAELGRTVPKAKYEEVVPALRGELLEIQQRLKARRFPVILLFGGVDGAGKSETVNLLHEWMDPRWLITHAYGPPSDEMAERPEYWRYWRDLPPKGRIGMFLSAWYSRPVLDRVHERASEADFDEVLERIVAFERALADDGALILKFWMHLGRDAQKRRFKTLEKNPLTRWRVTQTDWDHWRMYDRFVAAAERAIMRTSTGEAPWHIVEGWDRRHRSLTVGITLRDALRKHMQNRDLLRRIAASNKAEAALATAGDWSVDDPSAGGGKVIQLPKLTVLSRLDPSLAVDKKAYAKQLEVYQGRLNQRFREAKALGISTILVFEGWDAAGKGGAIRRVTAALDARDYEVIPFAAPTDEERAQHYLWRFWRHLPRAGRLTIFDRSWYGRVLVERVEGFASEPEWRRAYAEINDFEDQLFHHGMVLCKFWLHITKDEQRARFQRREQVEYKRWKLTDEDWRNREKWELYETAVNDMIERTSTRQAPWTLVEANDKRHARIKVLKIICEGLKNGIARHESAEVRLAGQRSAETQPAKTAAKKTPRRLKQAG
jgi:polyphosphate:AMP phosphotransferase